MTYNRKLIIALVSGFLLGALWLVAFRFLTYKDTRIHYHANFALYVNGQRDEFKSSTFYEETQSCSAEEIGPRTRVHLHDSNPSIVHVHDQGATWGHLFANLGYGLTNKSVTTDKGTYVNGQNNVGIAYILNGKSVSSIANETIENEDTLVVDVFTDNDGTAAMREAPQPPENKAAEYNAKSDPSACSGSQPLTFTERLKKAIGLTE